MKFSNSSGPVQIYSIENLRGVASLMVMICHLALMNCYLHLSMLMQLQQGVTLFFAISGFIIPYSMYTNGYKIKNFGKFILRRIYRIEPPYLTTVCLSCLVIYYFTPTHTLPRFTDMLLHIGYLIPFFQNSAWIVHVYWTLAIEFQFYILIAFLFPLILKFTKYASVLVCFSLCFLIFVKIPGIKNSEMLYSNIHPFSIGIFTFLFFIKRFEKREYFLGLIIYLILGKLLVSYMTGIMSVVSSLAIIFLNKRSALGNFYGKISYSLYITHAITLILLGYFFGYLFSPNHLLLNAVFIIACGLICVAVAYLFYILVEEPFLKYSKKVRY